MRGVAWTDFFSRCSPRAEGAGAAQRRRSLARALLALLLVLCLPVGGPARAGADAPQWQLVRSADALFLSARVPLVLPPAWRDALERGVPLHFIWRAEVRQPRWYWRDKRLAVAQRSVRVAYQPLTQRWRLSVFEGVDSASPALHQTLDRLDEALALAGRVVRWRIADAAALSGDERVEVEFRLDTGQLPLPLQILPGAAPDDGTPQWRALLPVPAAADSSAEGSP
jgi:hypothetical protein